MMIDPGSDLGRRLIASGVPEVDLLHTRIRVWRFQGALTAALPGGRATILCPRTWIEDQKGYGYAWRHETVHVAQAARWGFVGYWRRHLAARLRTRSLLAKDDPVEIEAYEAERAFSTFR